MKKFVLFSFLLLSLHSHAQLTNVVGTITDTSGQVWSNAQVNATFIPTPSKPGPFIWSGGDYQTQLSTYTDANGNFTLPLAPNDQIAPAFSQWDISACPNATTQCSDIKINVITTTTQNISSLINAALSAISISGTPLPKAYNQGEVKTVPSVGAIYYDTILNLPRYWNGTSWQNFLGDNFNYIDVNNQPGSDLGTQISNANTACGASPCNLLLTGDGTITTTPNISNGNSLTILHGFTINGLNSINLIGNNNVSCLGSSTMITSNIHAGAGIFTTASGATNVSIDGCYLNAPNGAYLVYAPDTLKDSRITNFNIAGGGAFEQAGAAATDPSLRVTIQNGTMTGAGPQGVVVYGAAQNFLVDNLTIDRAGTAHGVEFYQGDTASTPPEAVTIANGSGDNTMSNIHCTNVVSCAWATGVYRTKIVSSTATHCGDYCFGFEGSVDSGMISSIATDCGLGTGAGCYGFEYANIRPYVHASTSNEYNGNEGIFVSLTDESQLRDADFSGNNLNCIAPPPTISVPNPVAVPCAALYMPFSSNTSFSYNHVVNGFIVLPQYNTSQLYQGNTFTANVNIGTTMLYISGSRGGGTERALDNVLIATVPQTGACMGAANLDFNSSEKWEFGRNTCDGFATDFVASDGNPHLGQWMFLHDNRWGGNIVNSNPSTVILVREHNCIFAVPEVCDAMSAGSAGFATNTPDTWNGATIPGPNYQFNGRVILANELHLWSPVALAAGLPNDWRPGVDGSGLLTFSICPISFTSACTVTAQFLPNSVVRFNSLNGSGSALICADLNGSLFRANGTGSTCGTPPSSLTALPQASTTTLTTISPH